MNESKIIIAIYYGGQFVTVQGEANVTLLSELFRNRFGTSLESAKRKDLNRRGPTDRRIISYSDTTKLDPNSILLTLSEAYFLIYTTKFVTIYDHRSGEAKLLDLNSCWSLFRSVNRDSIILLDFVIEYGVYHYFSARGWTIRSGENYGANFLLYRVGPSHDHAQYAVVIMQHDNPHSWDTLLAYHRVIQSVSKELLLVYIEIPSTIDEPGCVSRMKLSTRIFTRYSPNSLNLF